MYIRYIAIMREDGQTFKQIEKSNIFWMEVSLDIFECLHACVSTVSISIRRIVWKSILTRC